jgi:23S rRNA pseudouridine2457 synthase
MTAAVGFPTLRLLRIAIGRLDLLSAALQPGQWGRLTPEQVGLMMQPADHSQLSPLLFERHPE